MRQTEVHPVSGGAPAIKAFLGDLATSGSASPSTQNQALSAILFLLLDVLGVPVGRLVGLTRAKSSTRLPVVLTRPEVQLLLASLTGVPQLVCGLLYGSGVRLLEGLKLRVKDLDFDRHQITVRQGKGRKDRVTLLPASLVPSLQEHLTWRQTLHAEDLSLGYGKAPLDHGLASGGRALPQEWGWQWVFPATSHYVDRTKNEHYRHHSTKR